MNAKNRILERPDIKPLWTNCKDSLQHAACHFEELHDLKMKNGSLEEKTHNAKWAVLSVGHAADCYLKIIAKDLDPTFPDSIRGNRRRKQQSDCDYPGR